MTIAQLIAACVSFLTELLDKRVLLASLTIRNIKSGYLGSVLGITWILIEPLVYVLLLWFFFTKALKVQPPQGYPFVPWLMTSMCLWNFFTLTLAASTGTFRQHSFLLKRAEFNMSVLPVINIFSGLVIHGIALLILISLLLFSDIHPTLYWLQAFYYLFATAILLLGLCWITSSLSLFIKDVGNVIGVLMQIGFWISPIFWSPETFPKDLRFLVELNPMTYLMEGYRKSFLYAQPFWEDIKAMAYFWSLTIVVLAIGAFTYRRLRPHFGDVI
jgi:lipopolysaccharide transport system permease protein